LPRRRNTSPLKTHHINGQKKRGKALEGRESWKFHEVRSPEGEKKFQGRGGLLLGWLSGSVGPPSRGFEERQGTMLVHKNLLTLFVTPPVGLRLVNVRSLMKVELDITNELYYGEVTRLLPEGRSSGENGAYNGEILLNTGQPLSGDGSGKVARLFREKRIAKSEKGGDIILLEGGQVGSSIR